MSLLGAAAEAGVVRHTRTMACPRRGVYSVQFVFFGGI